MKRVLWEFVAEKPKLKDRKRGLESEEKDGDRSSKYVLGED
jgi:hypothetical protein